MTSKRKTTSKDASSQLHPRAMVARESCLNSARWSGEFLRGAANRFDHCLHWMQEWQGWLQESQYSRRRDAAEESGDMEQFKELKVVQRARRLSYFGWKLAAFAALGEVFFRFREYSRDVSRVLEWEPSPTFGVGESSSLLQWLKAPGCEDTVRANGTFFGSEKFIALRDDATGGGGLEALDRAYDSFVRRSAVASGFGPGYMFALMNTDDEYIWDRKYEPFQRGGHLPYTFVYVQGAWGNPLIGNDLMRKYRDLLDKQPDGTGYPFELLGAVEKAFADLNEPQYEERRKLAERGSEWEQAVQIPQLDLLQGYRRAEFVRLVRSTQTWLSRIDEFVENLGEFIELHRTSEGAVEKMPSEFERMVSKYNLLAAVAMARSMRKLTEKWRSSAALSIELADSLESKAPEYFSTHVQDMHRQLTAMNSALFGRTNDPAAQAAHAFLDGELEWLNPSVRS